MVSEASSQMPEVSLCTSLGAEMAALTADLLALGTVGLYRGLRTQWGVFRARGAVSV